MVHNLFTGLRVEMSTPSVRLDMTKFHMRFETMIGRILLIGEDPILLSTRAMLLSDWETVITNSLEAAAVMEAQPFDIVIIGQLVTHRRFEELISHARMLDPAPALFAIRYPGECDRLGIEIHQTNSWDNPAWLKERVAELLAQERLKGRHHLGAGLSLKHALPTL
jgi:hypothetical protein